MKMTHCRREMGRKKQMKVVSSTPSVAFISNVQLTAYTWLVTDFGKSRKIKGYSTLQMQKAKA